MRIVAGIARGRRLRAPKGRLVRPTADRVKEAVFSILESRDGCVGRAVLDLFAGAGTLGIEALSRGASEAVFVEPDPSATEAIVCWICCNVSPRPNRSPTRRFRP